MLDSVLGQMAHRGRMRLRTNEIEMEKEAIELVEAKSPKEAIIEPIVRDFTLAAFTAGTQFE